MRKWTEKCEKAEEGTWRPWNTLHMANRYYIYTVKNPTLMNKKWKKGAQIRTHNMFIFCGCCLFIGICAMCTQQQQQAIRQQQQQRLFISHRTDEFKKKTSFKIHTRMRDCVFDQSFGRSVVRIVGATYRGIEKKHNIRTHLNLE